MTNSTVAMAIYFARKTLNENANDSLTV